MWDHWNQWWVIDIDDIGQIIEIGNESKKISFGVVAIG